MTQPTLASSPLPAPALEPTDPVDAAAFPPRPGFWSLARVALEAARFRPPLFLQSVFGPTSTWLARHRELSEFTIIDPLRPGRTLSYLSRITVPSVHATPPPLGELLPGLVRDLVWRPTEVFDHPPRAHDRADELDRPGERWFFINGIATNRAVARLNAELIAEIFRRRVTVIQNSTNSLLVDLTECAVGKEFKDEPDLVVPESFTEPCLVATEEILEAVRDPEIERVVVLAHSQGTIIVANVLRAMARALRAEEEAADRESGLESVLHTAIALARDMPRRLAPLVERFETALVEFAEAETKAPRRLEKLEIYAFATCADTMKYVSHRGRRPIPWIENFANERDVVARLGVLSPFQPTPELIDIDGPVYRQRATRRPRDGGWGHLLNQHYLFVIGDHLARRPGGDPGTAPPSPFVGRPDDPPVPRLFGYAGGHRPADL